MTKLYKILFFMIILNILLFASISLGNAAKLTLPAKLTIIEPEAFYGDTSLDKVILPEGVKRIEALAFSCSSVRVISLPSSLEYIAADAFEGCSNLCVDAPAGSYALQWAIDHHLLTNEYSAEEDFDYQIGEADVTITGYHGTETNLHLPAYIQGHPVSSIKSYAFSNNSHITSVVIPDTITTIEAYAFSGCTGIIKLVLPRAANLGDYAFKDLTGLKEVTIPIDIVTKIFFQGCTNVETIHYIKGNTGVMPDWFDTTSGHNMSYQGRLEYYSHETLRSIDFEEGITHIGNYAYFGGEFTFDSITLPTTLKSIGDGSFYGIKGISSIILPDGLETMGNACFAYSSLESVSIPESMAVIPYRCFEECNALVTIALPKTLKEIGNYAFYKCVNLTANPIPENGSMVSIGTAAFRYCIGLTELTLPETIVDIHDFAFSDCTGINKLVLPRTANLGEYSFNELTGLKEVTIPVDLITKMFFQSCTNVQTIHYIMGNTGVMPDWFDTTSGHNMSYQGRLEYYSHETLRSIDFEEGITHIGNYAYFGGDFTFDSIMLPTTLKSIGDGSFYGIKGISSIDFPDGLETMGNACFAYSSLESVSIPESMETIPYRCFEGSDTLTSIVLPKSLQSIEEKAFYNCKLLTSVPLYENGCLTRIGVQTFRYCTGLTELIIPDTVESIGSYAFSDCSNISKLVLPQTVALGDYAFNDLTGLKEVTIPVDIITKVFFQGCTNVKTIHYIKGSTGVMPDWVGGAPGQNMSYTGRLEYYSRETLRNIDFSEGVTHIGNYAYYCGDYGDFALTTVKLPESLESIGINAFYKMPNLEQLNIEEKCSIIGEGNFYKCHNLVVSVNRYNNTAIVWLRNNFIPFYYSGVLQLTAYNGWLYSEDTTPLYVMTMAEGGLRPYQYRFSLRKDEELLEQTDWTSNRSMYFYPEEHAGNWQVRAEVQDAAGKVVATDWESVTEYIDFSDLISLRKAFLDLVDSAPSTSSLNGYMFNEGMEEVSWLNTAIDLLHADLSILKTQEAKQQYLFEEAFKAAATGNTITLWDDFNMPDAVKALGKLNGLVEEDYYNALISFTNAYGFVAIDVTYDNLKNLFKQYNQGSIDETQLTPLLSSSFYNMSSDNIETAKYIFKSIKNIKRISNFLEGIGYVVEAGGGLIDIYNQWQMLQAMDPAAARAIAATYLKNADTPYQVAGNRLMAIVNASGSIEDQVALIVYGTVADVGIDVLLDKIKLSKGHPLISAAYYATDFITGSGSYAKAMNTLQWACDALFQAEDDFLTAREMYVRLENEENFKSLLYRYTNYLELAASVEEAYVDVIKWQEKTPICDTPNFVIRQKGISNRKAEALRQLAEKVRTIKGCYESESYAEAAAWLSSCAEDQNVLKNLGFTTISGVGGGGW